MRAQPLQARVCRQNLARRYQSTQSSSSSNAAPNSHTQGYVVGGLAGGVSAFLITYMFYHFSGAKSAVQTSKQVKQYYDATVQKAKQSAPAPNEALDWLRKQSTFYAGFVPGGSKIVDTTFNDIDAIRNKHGKEVDQITSEAYNELKDLTNKGLSMDTAAEAWQVLQKHMKRITELAGDAAEDILNNHPEIKDKVGGNIDQLKQMGKQYGPQAREQVDQTWEKIQEILKGGISFGTVDQIRKLVQEKTEQVKKMGDQAWQKGIEEAKPYLDKTPKVKELIEKNQDALRQGNISQLWPMIKKASESGNTQDLEQYVNQTVQKAKESTGGMGSFDQYLNMIPGGTELLPKFQQIQELSQKHGKEAEQLANATITDLKNVLEKRLKQGKELADKLGKESGAK